MNQTIVLNPIIFQNLAFPVPIVILTSFQTEKSQVGKEPSFKKTFMNGQAFPLITNNTQLKLFEIISFGSKIAKRAEE
ncbi:hypothetical protein [Sphingobacterium puteale]|uniref:hypothetical protein n=1 Tax=Sphingobacterium puteale TaxID=2420510 RepID=UPI003D979AD6